MKPAVKAYRHNALVKEFGNDFKLFKAMLISCYEQDFFENEVLSWQKLSIDNLDENEERASIGFTYVCLDHPRRMSNVIIKNHLGSDSYENVCWDN